ncbi:MAG TPA: response regulator [Patescibacteria group bacterium]|nr:response regulator [Patescibacteria group bacterium]
MLVSGVSDTITELCRLSELGGHVCIAFDDFSEAIKAYGREPQRFDLIVLDSAEADRTDGMAVLKKLREIDSAGAIVLMIDAGCSEAVVTAVNEGVYGILWKPLDTNGFLKALARREDELELQQKSRDEQGALVKEYIKLKREFGEVQVLLRKYEALLDKSNAN